MGRLVAAIASLLLRVASLCSAAPQLASADAVCAKNALPVASAVLLQTTLRLPPEDVGGVLFMVKSYEGFYESKLRALLKTWGSTVSKSSLLVIGDKAWSEFPIQEASMCRSGPTQGLSCRVAYGFTVAARHPGNWSWLYVVDDDMYIRPSLVRKKLAAFDASKPVGAGCYGCGTPQYCDGHGGFCGGCGYAFSRPAVMAMVGSNATEFQAFHKEISYSKKSDGREDMAISCAMRERVPELKVESMSVEGAPPNFEDLRRHAATDKSLGWHHVTGEDMERIHLIFAAVRSRG